jgi:hypothetical protein
MIFDHVQYLAVNRPLQRIIRAKISGVNKSGQDCYHKLVERKPIVAIVRRWFSL